MPDRLWRLSVFVGHECPTYYAASAPFSRLHQTHAALDKAVDAAYGYTGRHDDAKRVAFLFERYQALA